MTAEVKLRTLASEDVVLQSYLGTAPFRWADKQLPQGWITRGACVRVLRVSTAQQYAHDGHGWQTWPRFQIDVLAVDPELARATAAAIVDWLETAHLDSDAQFLSPPSTPVGRASNFLLNQRAGMDYNIEPPVHVETLDVRCLNLEN